MLFCVLGMCLLVKFFGVCIVLYIQDYEVDVMLGLGFVGKGKGGKVVQLVMVFECSGLYNVDNVFMILCLMMNKVIEKGVVVENVIFFFNWLEIVCFQYVVDVDVDVFRNQFDLLDNKKIIFYFGNIGEKQGLENVIEVVDCLCDELLIFVIVGQGGGKVWLEKMVQQCGLCNM